MNKRLGRHRTLYQDLRTQGQFLPCDNRLRDIANASFESDRLRIECWPSTNRNGRHWGVYGNDKAVILHFKMRARHERAIKVEEFELTMLFARTEAAIQAIEEDLENPIQVDDTIALIDVPCPDHAQSKGSSWDRDGTGVWTFRGDTVGGPSPGAKWSWEAKTYDAPMLHAGVALIHPNEPFLARCYVKGKATRLNRKIRFENDARSPVYLHLRPEQSDDDLEHHVGQLNDLIKARIFGTQVPSDPSHIPAAPSQDKSETIYGQRSYSSTSISGSAIVQLGDIHHHHHGMQAQESAESSAESYQSMLPPIPSRSFYRRSVSGKPSDP